MALTSNPVLRDDTYSSQSGPFVGGAGQSGAMSIGGVIAKSAILLLLLMLTFFYAWDTVTSASDGSGSVPLIMAGGLIGFVLSLVISFKPTLAPILAPIFALAQGLALGAISAFYEYQVQFSNNIPSGYEGIVFQAALGTAAVFASMLILYRTRIVRVTERMRAVVSVAMLGIVLVYMISFVLSLFGSTIPLIHESGLIGIGFSLLVIGIASFMLLVDFDSIERGVATGAPKYMEWYSAFALLVTLVWIYLEMLRLLSKLRR